MLTQLSQYSPPSLLLQPVFNTFTLLSEISSYFRNLLVPSQYTSIRKMLFGVGIAALTFSMARLVYKQYRFWNWLPAFFARRKVQQFVTFKKRYGRCYVLITGAADGIGYAFARQWASLGFDLLLVDIQKDKLHFRTRQIIETYKDIQVQSFVVDMSSPQQIQKLISQIDVYEIGILINNVGLTGGGPYLQVQAQTLTKTLQVNYTPMHKLTQHLLPKLRNRTSRSAIITLSSATGVYFSHNVGAYSSIKHAVDIYSRTLAQENCDKIDVLSVRPFGVSTGMMKMRKEQRIITPKACVQGVLAQLGNVEHCFPGKDHKIMAAFFQTLGERERLDVFNAAWDKNKKIKQ